MHSAWLVLFTAPGNLVNSAAFFNNRFIQNRYFSITAIDDHIILFPSCPFICCSLSEIREPTKNKNIYFIYPNFILKKKAKNDLIAYFGVIGRWKNTIIWIRLFIINNIYACKKNGRPKVRSKFVFRLTPLTSVS